MTEKELLIHAKNYIDKLANGINPLTGEPVADDDIVNNVRISRCLFYVSSVLKSVIDKQQTTSSYKKTKKAFELPLEKRLEFAFSDRCIPVSELANRINALANLDEFKKLNYSQITKWLISICALEIKEINGKTIKVPTEQGFRLGIFTEQRQGTQGEYTVIVYNKSAQQFILDNLEAICAKDEATEKGEYQGQPWPEEHQSCLIELFQKQVPVSEIAITLQRSEGAVRARLKKLGLIEHRKDAK